MKWTALILVGLALFLVSPLASAQALPTADLTELEKKVQGVWRDGYTIVIEGRNFCADTTRGEWYEGKIVIREDTEPKQFDFVIENCACGFRWKTSAGILRFDGDEIEIVSAVPGEERPTSFEATDKVVVTRLPGKKESSNPATHCLGEPPAED